jgi:glycosyltransferase involved in cell wall biosynthesis
MHQLVPIKIVHFHNGKSGGISSVIQNLIAYSENPFLENHIIYTINLDENPNFKVANIPGAVSQKIFYYSADWNIYKTCKRLCDLLPDKNAVLIAHDWLELAMVSNLGLRNPVVQFIHGAYPYYYDLAEKCSNYVDLFIVVAETIAQQLIGKIPLRKSDIQYLRFPVADFKKHRTDSVQEFTIVFVGRCEEGKGYFLLPKIEEYLKQNRIKVKWEIVGLGSENKKLQVIWPESSDITFHGEISSVKLNSIYSKSNIIILPSRAEGMPLSVIEAMKVGVIPIVNDLECGLKEIIIDDISGFRVKNNSVLEYVRIISDLYSSPEKVNELSVSVSKLSLDLFDPVVNTKIIEDSLIFVANKSHYRKPSKLFGSRLDIKWMPNIFITVFRKYIKPQLF